MTKCVLCTNKFNKYFGAFEMHQYRKQLYEL